MFRGTSRNGVWVNQQCCLHMREVNIIPYKQWFNSDNKNISPEPLLEFICGVAAASSTNCHHLATTFGCRLSPVTKEQLRGCREIGCRNWDGLGRIRDKQPHLREYLSSRGVVINEMSHQATTFERHTSSVTKDTNTEDVDRRNDVGFETALGWIRQNWPHPGVHLRSPGVVDRRDVTCESMSMIEENCVPKTNFK